MTESQAPEMRPVRTDSSDLAEPRVLIRTFLEPGRPAPGIEFYERLQGVAADARFSFPEADPRLAVAGAFLLIEGSAEAVASFLSTAGTLLVDDVYPYYDRPAAEGAEITEPLQEVPTGTGSAARRPDGTVVEYVHHRPNADGRGHIPLPLCGRCL
ncbi:hypothetical protein J0910_18115 [Nocardiopsis sp. CNT-189]|uniref:hypothetical protein n=1 Tax=Nocardiopsis oceanisediminis TaxID=2816862 RepID=UPI003B2AEE61